MAKFLRNFLICMFCCLALVSVGFSAWSFTDLNEGAVINQAQVNVEADSSLGNLNFVSPVEDGFLGYNLVFDNEYNSASSSDYLIVKFMPNIRFVFSNYEDSEQTDRFYFYVTFSTTSSLFSSVENDSGYIYFDTSVQGQSAENMIALNVRNAQGELRYRVDQEGQPVLNNGQYVFEIEETFSPTFKYRVNKKPTNATEYKNMLNVIKNNVGESLITFHIVYSQE